MAALFLWFGSQQLLHPGEWTGFLPLWVWDLPLSPELFVRMNGAFEVAGAALLIVGFFTRLVALALGAHLMVIAISVGTTGGDAAAIGVRDAALAAATLALAWSHVDEWTFDAKRKKQKTAAVPAAPVAH